MAIVTAPVGAWACADNLIDCLPGGFLYDYDDGTFLEPPRDDCEFAGAVTSHAGPTLAGKMAAPGEAPPRVRQGDNPADSWTKQQIADFLNQHEDLLRKADPDLSFPIDPDGYLKADLLVLVHAVLKELDDSTPSAPA